MQNKNKNKGFTLVELMIVIAILAILAAIVIFALNPAELFKRARDSQRLSDLRVLSSAISYYLADQTSPNLTNSTTANDLCVGGTTATIFATATAPTTLPGTWAWTNSTVRTVAGAGWLKIDFTGSGSPIGQLPMDPSNTGPAGNPSLYYAFACETSLNYEINAQLESTSYATKASGDGGDLETVYEVGTDLTILPATITDFFPN